MYLFILSLIKLGIEWTELARTVLEKRMTK